MSNNIPPINNVVMPPQLIQVNIQVTEYLNNPAIELRKRIVDMNIIKAIISAAYHKQPVIIVPVFSNEIQALNSLQQKGIIYFNFEKNDYYFTN